MSVYRGLDWYVIDEFGDIWNEEALPTFDQAYSYRGQIRPLLNRITELSIRSVERGNEFKSEKRQKPKYKESFAPGADF